MPFILQNMFNVVFIYRLMKTLPIMAIAITTVRIIQATTPTPVMACTVMCGLVASGYPQPLAPLLLSILLGAMSWILDLQSK